MEIEVLEENPRKEDKKDKKREMVHRIKKAIESADWLTDELYDLAASKETAEKDRNEFIDIIVASKGISKALGEILGRHSDLDEKIRKKIDEGADAFAEGLMGEDKKGYAETMKEG